MPTTSEERKTISNQYHASCAVPHVMADKPNTAIMKPVGDFCNLRCDYCYLQVDHKVNHGNKLNKMSSHLVDQVMRQFSDVAGAPVHYIWHGGEPLLAGKDFYREVIRLQKAYPQEIFRNSIQTNGTLIDSEWADFFAEHKFVVSVSIDGPPEVHNAHRHYRNGKGGFDAVISGLQTLRTAGIKVSCVVVISKASLPYANQILQFLLDIKMNIISLNPHFEDDLDFAVTPDEYADFLCKIFDKYAAFKDSAIVIEPFDTMVKPFIGEQARLCHYSGTCTSFIAIMNDGGINPCNRFSNKSYEFGNVLNGGMQAALQSQARQNFIKVIQERVTSCEYCKWFKFCHGSCTKGYIDKPGIDGPYCQSNKKVLQYMEDNFAFQSTNRSGGRQN